MHRRQGLPGHRLVRAVAVPFAAIVLALAAAGARADTDPCRSMLPLFLTSGWEAADADPREGVLGLDHLDWRPGWPSSEPGHHSMTSTGSR